MIKVLVPLVNGRDIYDINIEDENPIDRPFVVNYMGRLDLLPAFLPDHYHCWLTDQHIDYDLLNEIDYGQIHGNKWYIIFEKESDAILFKLTWC